MLKHTLVGALALLGLMANPLVALGDTPARPSITIWYALKAPYGDQFSQMVKGYETAHPYLSVDPHNYGDSEALRSALAGASVMPDVVLIDAAWQDDLIGSQRLVPIEDLMADASNMARIVCKADTFPPLFQLSLRDGKLWTLPTFCTDTALIYNPSMFASKKIKTPPNTWGDLLTDAKKLTDVNAGVWGFQLPISQSGMDMGHLFSVMLWQMGADLTTLEEPTAPVAPTSDGGSSAAVSLAPTPAPAAAAPAPAPTASTATTSPAAQTSGVKPSAPVPSAPVATPGPPTPSERLMTFLIDMVYRYKVSPADSTGDPTKVAMMFGTPETLLTAEAKGVKLDAAPFPMNKVKVSEMSLYNYAVTKDAKDPKEAYQFVNWCAGFEQQVVWATTTPYLPANKQVTLSPQYFAYLGDHPGLRTFLKEMGVGRLRPTVSHYTRILSETADLIVHAISIRQSAGDACHSIVDKTRYLINMPHTSTSTPTAH